MSEETETQLAVASFQFTLYDPSTGEVMQVGACENLEQAQLLASVEGLELYEGYVDANTHYILDEVSTLRPVAAFDKLEIAADGVDTATIEIPAVFTARIDGVKVTTSSELALDAPHPGSFRVQIDHFPYIPVDVRIVAS